MNNLQTKDVFVSRFAMMIGFSILCPLSLFAQTHFQKVVWIIFENTDYATAMKSPILKKIASQGALFDNFFAETHPSQPNYIAMIAGSPLGVRGDGNVDLMDKHIGDSLEENGKNWHVYAENYPGNCFLGAKSGEYVRKHTPFVSFRNVTTNPSRCAKITNEVTFQDDWKTGRLADYNMYVPNMINDGHQNGISDIEPWIQKTLYPFFDDVLARRDILVLLTFDEGSWGGNNQVYTVALGAGIAPGTVIHQRYNHIDLLGLIQTEFHLGKLPKQMATLEITGLWN